VSAPYAAVFASTPELKLQNMLLKQVVDIPTDHPSCSKQHAAIQFRQVEVTKPDGKLVMTVKYAPFRRRVLSN